MTFAQTSKLSTVEARGWHDPEPGSSTRKVPMAGPEPLMAVKLFQGIQESEVLQEALLEEINLGCIFTICVQAYVGSINNQICNI